MAFARVVSFEGVGADRIEQLTQSIESGERPPELPATEFLLLYDPDAKASLAVMFFDTEEDYAKGDEIMNAMDPGDTPGSRTSVKKYRVAVRAQG